MSTSQLLNSSVDSLTLYELIGGETGTQQLVKAFYDIVETNPIGQKLHLLHLRGNGIAHSRVEQFNFLSGFLGGPKLYVEKHGYSNIRNMHEHVVINKESKDIWLSCMSIAIDQVGIKVNTKEKLMNNFTLVADKLVNQQE
jgi:hemoglobin